MLIGFIIIWFETCTGIHFLPSFMHFFSSGFPWARVTNEEQALGSAPRTPFLSVWPGLACWQAPKEKLTRATEGIQDFSTQTTKSSQIKGFGFLLKNCCRRYCHRMIPTWFEIMHLSQISPFITNNNNKSTRRRPIEIQFKDSNSCLQHLLPMEQDQHPEVLSYGSCSVLCLGTDYLCSWTPHRL